MKKGQWRRAGAKNNPRCGMGAAMTYDSKRGLMLLYGGPGRKAKRWNASGPEFWSYSVKENAWTRLPDGPVASRAPGLAHSSKHDVAMIHVTTGKRQPSATCLYFPEKKKWLRLKPPAGAEQPPATYHGLAYDEAHDVFVRAGGTWSEPQWWLFRLVPGKLPGTSRGTK